MNLRAMGAERERIMSLTNAFGVIVTLTLRGDRPEADPETIIKTFRKLLESLVREFPGIHVEPFISRDVVTTLRQRKRVWDRTQAEDILKGFSRKIFIRCPPRTDRQKLAARLAELPDVKRVDLAPPPPSKPQNYRKTRDAEWGVNADAIQTMATRPHNRGKGITLWVVTRSWHGHRDLPLSFGDKTISVEQLHGLNVLGITSALDNDQGLLGLAPEANVQPRPLTGTNEQGVSQAIVDVADQAAFGDVLLIDAQTDDGMPVEVWPQVRQALELAEALGIVVVEPAGHPPVAIDLDSVLGPYDSGALMVTALDRLSEARWDRANYGSRVDLCALGIGARVYTLSWDNGDDNGDAYAGASENGTRIAAAIIAGVAVSAQSMYAEAHQGERLGPGPLRELLRQSGSRPPALAIPSSCGVLPDLLEVSKALGVAADVMVRDRPADVGAPNATMDVYSSPDIIPRTSEEANPQTAFDNNPACWQELEWGQDNYIYVRVTNRGGSKATDVTASLYWAEPSTILPITHMNYIGTINGPDIGSGECSIIGPFKWDPRATGAPPPPPGSKNHSYCLGTTVGCDQDPEPGQELHTTTPTAATIAADNLSWSTYVRMIRDNNNIAWRNITIVDVLPDVNSIPPPHGGTSGKQPFGGVTRPLEVFVPGVGGPARTEIGIVTDLPESATISIEAPQAFARSLLQRPEGMEIDAERTVARFPVQRVGRPVFWRMLLKKGDRHKIRLHVNIPPTLRNRTYEIAVVHRCDDLEAGRFTFRLVPKKG
jgi:serine protease